MLPQVIRRLRDGQYYRALGRFHLCRRAYSQLNAVRQRLLANGVQAVHAVRRPSLVRADSSDVVGALRTDGISIGLELAETAVAALVDFAREQPCTRPHRSEAFRIDEVVNGRLADGRRVADADVLGVCENGIVRSLMDDQVLLAIARGYLGYAPQRIIPRLWWSCASDLAPWARRNLGQAVDFHYDIEGYNCLYVFFYLIDTDLHSGAHVAVRGSHSRKRLRMIFSTTAKPDRAILDYYGQGNLICIEGPAGLGFFEDPACYHKMLPTMASDRLILQLRYS